MEYQLHDDVVDASEGTMCVNDADGAMVQDSCSVTCTYAVCKCAETFCTDGSDIVPGGSEGGGLMNGGDLTNGGDGGSYPHEIGCCGM